MTALWWRFRDAGRWLPWESPAGTLTSAPSALSQDRGHIIVNIRGTDGRIWGRRFWNNRWEPWFRHDIALPAAPALAAWSRDRPGASAMGPGALVVAARGPGDNMITLKYG